MSSDATPSTTETADQGHLAIPGINQGLGDVEYLHGTAIARSNDVLSPAIVHLRQLASGRENPPELLEYVTSTEPDGSRIQSYVLSVQRLPNASSYGMYRIIAKSQTYIDPWKVFRLLDLPQSIRIRIVEFLLLYVAQDSALIIRDYSTRRNDDSNLSIGCPPWSPAIARTNRTLYYEMFPLFLTRVTVTPFSVTDLERLHSVLSAFKAPDGLAGHGYRYVQAIKLPHFFASPGPVNKRRQLELALLDRCENLRTLHLSLNTRTMTRHIFGDEEAVHLREPITLEELLDTYSIPLIFDCCRGLQSLVLECFDDDDVHRNMIAEPLRLFVSLVHWFREGFHLRLRDVAVTYGVRDGRFLPDGENVPVYVTPLPNTPLYSSIPVLERLMQRHWIFSSPEWVANRRARIADPWEDAASRGVDVAEVQRPGDPYQR